MGMVPEMVILIMGRLWWMRGIMMRSGGIGLC